MNPNITITVAKKISNLLDAQWELNRLFHSHKDDRGLELATALEREAHAIWRESGNDDLPTFELSVIASEISRSIYK
jgi:hypothetical protein